MSTINSEIHDALIGASADKTNTREVEKSVVRHDGDIPELEASLLLFEVDGRLHFGVRRRHDPAHLRIADTRDGLPTRRGSQSEVPQPPKKLVVRLNP